MVSGLEAGVVAAGVATTTAGILLAVRGVHTAATRFMAAWLVFFGLQQTVGILVGWDSRAWLIVTVLTFWSVLAFGVAYPGPGLSPMRRWAIVWLGIPAVAIGLFGDMDVLRRGFGLSEAILLVYTVAALMGVPLLLAWRALRTTSPLQRDQLAWLILPFVFWLVHDSVWVFFSRGVWVGMADAGPGRAEMIILAARAGGSLAIVAGMAAVAAWGAIRLGGEARRQCLVVLGAIAGFALVSPIQFLVAPGLDALVHPLLDTLFSILLFYGVARYGIVDLKLRLRWSLKHGTVASAFLAAFFVVSESATAFLGETTGSTYLGIAGAAMLVFAFGPIQRLAERFSERAVPMADGADAYIAYRRLRIYHAALEGALKDERVDAWEADALGALRRELGITDAEHALVEAEVRGRTSSAHGGAASGEDVAA